MTRRRMIFGRSVRFVALTVLSVLLGWNAEGRDAFVMLSGGYSPFDNNYSQYLQAKAVVTFFEQNYPRDSIWVFFGAGNVEGEKPIFCDVRREIDRQGTPMNSWLPGSLSHNRPAH